MTRTIDLEDLVTSIIVNKIVHVSHNLSKIVWHFLTPTVFHVKLMIMFVNILSPTLVSPASYSTVRRRPTAASLRHSALCRISDDTGDPWPSWRSEHSEDQEQRHTFCCWFCFVWHIGITLIIRITDKIKLSGSARAGNQSWVRDCTDGRWPGQGREDTQAPSENMGSRIMWHRSGNQWGVGLF